jgi:2-polyprenyl-3-methyl-5-hydroxy-6-metoxy-1,4-benzoquinol methylase
VTTRTLLGGILLGQRPDLGHGSERQASRWLWGIRRDHRHRYRFASHVIGSGAVLDVACGVGYGSYMLGRADPARTVLGRDRCARAIEFARRTYGRPNVAFECGDALGQPGEGRFDAIVSLETLEHIQDEVAFLRVLHRLARSRCTLVISTPNECLYPFHVSFNPHHVRHHTPDQLERLLAATGWNVVSRHCQRTAGTCRVVPGNEGRFLIYVAARA